MLSRRAFIPCGLAAAFLIVTASGCVGPMACGPDACGPFALNQCGGCGDCDGCGELYVDPWINHPPRCGDPCDQCGNYNGQSCGKCRSVFDGVRSLWGYRCGVDDCGGCDSAGCDSAGCGGACGSCGPLLGGGCGDCGSCDACCDSPRGFLESDHRTGCGCEVSCGCDGGCGGGCSDCGIASPYAASETHPGSDTHVSTTAPQIYRPHRERRIFTARRD